jgi:hypothetical protein
MYIYNTIFNFWIRKSLQIRKGNKVGVEGKEYTLTDYMRYAIKYFDEYELINQMSGERVIYLSTDDNQVIKEAKKKYFIIFIKI